MGLAQARQVSPGDLPATAEPSRLEIPESPSCYAWRTNGIVAAASYGTARSHTWRLVIRHRGLYFGYN
ncbi:MAG: hypothetical protein WBN31_05115, partial [Gammaproteobacteria bacterium]